jgi:hypothetical protein
MDKKRSITLSLLLVMASACGDDGGGSKPLEDAASESRGGGRDAGSRDSSTSRPMDDDDDDDDDEPDIDASTDEPNPPDMEGEGMDAAVQGMEDSGSPNPGGGQSVATIGVAGGQLKSPDGRLTLDIPAGALSRPTVVSIQTLATGPEGTVGTAYQITPAHEPIVRERGARVTLVYTAADLGGGSPASLQLGRHDESGWTELANAAPVPANMTVRGELVQFGTVALFSGFCAACPSAGACTVGTPCSFEPGVEGKCVAYGQGCGRCVPTCDGDGDGQCAPGDCNDRDPNINSNTNAQDPRLIVAQELCNGGVDDDCDGHFEEGCATCTSNADCAARESCVAGVCVQCDKGCSGTTCTLQAGETQFPGTCFGFGNDCSACVQVCDLDGDGYCPTADPARGQQGGDCDEANRNVNPGAREVCGNGLDDDCNGFTDDGCAACENDAACSRDGLACVDGTCMGCARSCEPGMACTIATGETGAGSSGKCVAFGKGCTRCVQLCDGDGDKACAPADCNDNDPATSPSAAEICGDNKDNDCDGHFDEGCKACTSDAECTAGFESCQRGSCAVCSAACENVGGACTQGNGAPGVCTAFGQGCSKCVWACDADGDGHCAPSGADAGTGETDAGVTPLRDDCDDTNAKIHPNTGGYDEVPAVEVCGNRADDNCDGRVDEFCTSCAMSNACMTSEACSSGR